MYYNTNRESGETLAKSQATTVSQEEKIYEYFQTRTRLGLAENVAPHDLIVSLFPDNTPITSIRRAITNLEKAGKLAKTDFMVMGIYGKMVHTWRIKEQQLELLL